MTTPYLNTTMIIDRHNILSKEQSTTNNLSTIEKHSKILNEQILSQKIHQLTPFENNQNKDDNTSSTDMDQSQTTVVFSTELTLLKMNDMDFDFIPDYLCKTNPSFEKKIHCILPSTVNLEELRDIAILMHKIMSIEIVHSLWIVYQKSVMGNLLSTALLPLTNQIDRNICPLEVQSLMKQSQMQYINEDDACLTFVNHCLKKLDDQSEQYRRKLNVKTSHLCDYTRSMECTIEKFIKQNLECFRIETDQQIALVQYDYTDQLLERAYLSQNPHENQIKLMKHLCKRKRYQELTKYEVNLLKEKISTYLPCHPFERESNITQSSLIDRISNPKIRQQLYKQYKNVAEQARNNMMTVYMKCAEEQKQQCQIQYDMKLKEIYDIEKTLPSYQRLTKAMWDLIEHVLANITARIECVYKFKRRLFHLKLNIH